MPPGTARESGSRSGVSWKSGRGPAPAQPAPACHPASQPASPRGKELRQLKERLHMAKARRPAASVQCPESLRSRPDSKDSHLGRWIV